MQQGRTCILVVLQKILFYVFKFLLFLFLFFIIVLCILFLSWKIITLTSDLN